MKAITLLILVAVLSGCNVECGEIGGNQIIGQITDDVDLCPIDYTNKIKIESYGGKINEALMIAYSVRHHATEIATQERCSSACILILSAGGKRSMCSNQMLGFHQSNTELGTDLVLRYFKSDPRFNYEMIEQVIINSSWEQLHYVGPNWALHAGLIDKIEDCHA